jgi:hypothetical protein
LRHLVPICAALVALALAGAAQAGEGCPYSKQAAVTASTDDEAPNSTAVAHHETCPHACAHAKSATADGSCPCHGAEGGGASGKGADAAQAGDVAAND